MPINFKVPLTPAPSQGTSQLTNLYVGPGLAASLDTRTEIGTIALQVPVSVANGGTGSTSLAGMPFVPNTGAAAVTSGSLVVNGTASAAPTPLFSPLGLQVIGQDNQIAPLELDAFGNPGFPANVTLRKAGGTAASPSQTAGGAAIANIGVSGYGTTGWASGYRAAFQFLTTELWTDTAQGTRITVSTTPTGTIAPVQQMNIGQGLMLGMPGTELGRGSLVANMNAAAPPAATGGATVQVTGVDGASSVVEINSFGANPTVIGRRANGTGAAPTALPLGSTLATFQGRGYGATGWSGNRGSLWFNTTENWTDTAQGSYAFIQTTPTGTVATETPVIIARGMTLGTASATVGADNGRGSLIANANVTPAVNAQTGAMLLLQQADTVANSVQFNAFGTASTGNHIWGYVAGGTAASPTALNSGGNIINIEARGYDGSAWSLQQAAVQISQVTSPWTTADHSTKVQFNATPIGSTAVANVATMSAGMVIGAPTGGDKGAATLNATGVYAAGVLLTSDASLKRDINVLPDDCLALVGAIEPKQFKFIDPGPTPNDDPDIGPTPSGPPGWFDKTRWGFVAQDVEAAMHEVDFDGVEAGSDGIRSLDYNSLMALLWKAVRELSAEVDQLKGRAPRQLPQQPPSH